MVLMRENISWFENFVRGSKNIPTYCDVADDGGSDKVAILITFDLDVSAIEEKLSTFIHAALDETADSVSGLRGDQGPHVRTSLVP